jgi:2-polyprenyl-3-methyl-5-hydroxy-6-metoxy-1,4-benzoquinol methylase
MGGNLVENWDASYKDLGVTYSETPRTPGQLVNLVQFEFVLEDLRKYLPDAPHAKVIEVGCGGARTSLYLARRGYTIVGTDTSPEALRLARRNFQSAGAEGTFIDDDLMASKLPEGGFDAIMSFGLLEHFVDLDPLVASLTRLVRPGGIHIHCIIPKKFSTQTLADAAYFPFRLVRNIVTGRWENLISKSFRDFAHFENRFTAEEYKAAFIRGGNDVLRCEAAGVLLPFYSLPAGIGNVLTRLFAPVLMGATRKLDRTESKLLHTLSPTFYIVARRTKAL